MDPETLHKIDQLPEALLLFACRYVFMWGGENEAAEVVTIERFDNHGRWLKDGAWVVVRHLNGFGGDITNPLYLGKGGVWRYKVGFNYPSLDDAYYALKHKACQPGTRGWWQIEKRAHDPYVQGEKDDV